MATQLNYNQTIRYDLGWECIKFRRDRNSWGSTNVASIAVKFKDRNSLYTFTAMSNRAEGEHSEEQIVGMFTGLDGFNPEDIESARLFSERKPCVTTRVTQKTIPFDSPMITGTMTTTHTGGCVSFLKKHFNSIDAFHVVKSGDEHNMYMAWCQQLLARNRCSETVHRRWQNEHNDFKKVVYKCLSNHVVSVDLQDGINPDQTRDCLSYGCNEISMVAGWMKR